MDAASTAHPELKDSLRKLLTFMPMQAEVAGNAALQNLVKIKAEEDIGFISLKSQAPERSARPFGDKRKPFGI